MKRMIEARGPMVSPAPSMHIAMHPITDMVCTLTYLWQQGYYDDFRIIYAV